MSSNAAVSPRRTSCMRSSSASAESDIPPRPYAAGAPSDQRLTSRRTSTAAGPADLDRGGAPVALAAVLAAPAQDDEPRAGGGPDRDRGDRPDPVARIAHRRQLPPLELGGRKLGQGAQRRLEARREILGRVHRRERAADDVL